MVKGSICAGVGERACGGEVHVKDQVGEIEGGQVRGVEREYAGGVQRADGEGRCCCWNDGREIRDGRSAPGVAFEIDDSVDGGPEIGRYVHFEIPCGGVVEWCDDYGFVDVLGAVVEYFPASVVFDPRPRWRLPDVFELPV